MDSRKAVTISLDASGNKEVDFNDLGSYYTYFIVFYGSKFISAESGFVSSNTQYTNINNAVNIGTLHYSFPNEAELAIFNKNLEDIKTPAELVKLIETNSGQKLWDSAKEATDVKMVGHPGDLQLK